VLRHLSAAEPLSEARRENGDSRPEVSPSTGAPFRSTYPNFRRTRHIFSPMRAGVAAAKVAPYLRQPQRRAKESARRRLAVQVGGVRSGAFGSSAYRR
jgi:hypothetical protein